jgi:hypothetical protein
MFSLIITLVSIALVAALAVATIYYGGQVANKSRTKAIAATVVTQGTQLLGATTTFHATEGRYPALLEELVERKFLSDLPYAPRTVGQIDQRAIVLGIPEAHAAGAPLAWQQVQSGTPQFWLIRSVSETVCRAINAQVLGEDSIRVAAIPGKPVQCFGPAAPYTALVHLPSPQPLTETLPPASISDNETLPPLTSEETGGGYVIPPSGNGSSGEGPTPGGSGGSGEPAEEPAPPEGDHGRVTFGGEYAATPVANPLQTLTYAQPGSLLYADCWRPDIIDRNICTARYVQERLGPSASCTMVVGSTERGQQLLLECSGVNHASWDTFWLQKPMSYAFVEVYIEYNLTGLRGMDTESICGAVIRGGYPIPGPEAPNNWGCAFVSEKGEIVKTGHLIRQLEACETGYVYDGKNRECDYKDWFVDGIRYLQYLPR